MTGKGIENESDPESEGEEMNVNTLIQLGDKLEIVTRRAEDGTNDGSIIVMRSPGHAYCIAKAPKYTTDEEWRTNATLIIEAVRDYWRNMPINIEREGQ